MESQKSRFSKGVRSLTNKSREDFGPLRKKVDLDFIMVWWAEDMMIVAEWWMRHRSCT